MTTETRTVELYNLTRNANGYLVRVIKDGKTTFVKFGGDEAAARRFAAECPKGCVAFECPACRA